MRATGGSTTSTGCSCSAPCWTTAGSTPCCARPLTSLRMRTSRPSCRSSPGRGPAGNTGRRLRRSRAPALSTTGLGMSRRGGCRGRPGRATGFPTLRDPPRALPFLPCRWAGRAGSRAASRRDATAFLCSRAWRSKSIRSRQGSGGRFCQTALPTAASRTGGRKSTCLASTCPRGGLRGPTAAPRSCGTSRTPSRPR